MPKKKVAAKKSKGKPDKTVVAIGIMPTRVPPRPGSGPAGPVGRRRRRY